MIKPLHIIIKHYQRTSVILIGLLLCHSLNAAILRDKVTKTGIKIELGVDLNRDGQITFDSYTDGKLNPNDDKTSPERPFRFWLNNDFDAVSLRGNPKPGRKTCDKEDGGKDIKMDDGFQVCEQNDVVSGNNPNGSRFSTEIESVRDLEDFAPLAIRISPWSIGLKNIKIKLTGYGFELNLFKGAWESTNNATQYLTNRSVAIEQVKGSNYLGTMLAELPGSTILLGEDNFEFDNNKGVAKLIFEGGVGISDIDCKNMPEQCYLELVIEDNRLNTLATQRLYLQFNDIKNYYEHYTVGNYYHGPGSTHDDNNAFMEGERIVVPDSPSENLNVDQKELIVAKTTADQQQQNQDYILLVHGWRMKPAERVTFAETTFKRLYWAGYKGKFGLFSWPTSWFNKPAHLTEFQALTQSGASDDPQSYDRGEAAARRSGLRLVSVMEMLNTNHIGGVRVLAHSMGNVVVGEALKAYNGSNIISHYAASQAATVASAYQPGAGDSQVRTPITGQIQNFQLAWERNNTSNDFPTYRYKYATLRSDLTDADSLSDEYYTVYPNIESDPQINIQAYYHDITSKVGQIINFHNAEDAALDAWRFNASTKPDGGTFGPGGEWTFDRRGRNVENGAATNCNIDPCDYHFDEYYFDQSSSVDPVEIDYTLSGDDNIAVLGRPDILAYIIPGRSNPLGVEAFTGDNSVIQNHIDMNRNGPNAEAFGLTGSNYDHSAQFLSDYPTRKCYWSNLLVSYELLDPNNPDGTNIFPSECTLKE